MKNKFVPFIMTLIFLLLIGLQANLLNVARQKQMSQFVENILNLWQKGEIVTTQQYWINLNQMPPIFQISEYSIQNISFYKKGKTQYAKAKIFMIPTTNSMVQNKTEWTFELKKTASGWLIAGCY